MVADAPMNGSTLTVGFNHYFAGVKVDAVRSMLLGKLGMFRAYAGQSVSG